MVVIALGWGLVDRGTKHFITGLELLATTLDLQDGERY